MPYKLQLWCISPSTIKNRVIFLPVSGKRSSAWRLKLVSKFKVVIWWREYNFQEVKQIHKWGIWHCKSSEKSCLPGGLEKRLGDVCLSWCIVIPACWGQRQCWKGQRLDQFKHRMKCEADAWRAKLRPETDSHTWKESLSTRRVSARCQERWTEAASLTFALIF